MFSLDFVVDAMMMFHSVPMDTFENRGDPCVTSIEWLTADKQQKLVREEGEGWLKKRSSSHNPATPLSEMFSQTGNFASPPHDGFALIQIMGNKTLGRLKISANRRKTFSSGK